MFSLHMKCCLRFLSNFNICAFSVVSLSLSCLLSLMSFHVSLMSFVFSNFMNASWSHLHPQPRNLSPEHHILLRPWLLYLGIYSHNWTRVVRAAPSKPPGSKCFSPCVHCVRPSDGQGQFALAR